jgi:predicted Zn-dependent peptidase
MRVMDALLSGSFGSRITKNIREDKGYTYSPYSDLIFRPNDTLWSFNADVTTKVTGPALHEVFAEIRRLQGEAPPAEEANGMETYLAGLFVFQNSTSGGLVGSLAERDMLRLPDTWLDRYVPAVLAVSPAEISGEAREALPLDRATLVVVGDLETVEPQLRQLPELQGASFETVTVP